tara:strand:+ start:1046 stop:2164 length:1119 start_codon:yes stop_codon:yes gene_type:complete
LNVRDEQGELIDGEYKPTDVEDTFTSDGGIKTKIQNPFGGFFARRMSSVEGDDKYGTSTLRDVSNEVSYVVNAHGIIDNLGVSIDIPTNVKIFSPLTCLGQSLLFWGRKHLRQIKRACPSSGNFRDKYVLTHYNEIPEMYLGPENVEKEFGKGSTGLYTGAGVYECNDDASIYNPVPVISIKKGILLSEILEQLIPMSEGKDINIILLTCFNFEDLSFKDLGLLETKLDKETELRMKINIKENGFKNWKNLEKYIINYLITSKKLPTLPARLIPKTKMILSYLSTHKPLYHLSNDELPNVDKLGPDTFYGVGAKNFFEELTKDFAYKFNNTPSRTQRLFNYKSYFRKFANAPEQVRSIFSIIKEILKKIIIK